MKNIQMMLLAGSLLLGACQRDGVTEPGPGYPDEAIAFVTPYRATRSANLRDGGFKEGDKVGVLGYCRAENNGVDYSTSDWNTKKMFATPGVFYNQELTYAGNGAFSYDWERQGMRPWLDNPEYTYAFFAYHPYTEVSGRWGTERTGELETADGRPMGTITLPADNVTGDPVITYTMPHAGSSATNVLEWDVVPDFMLSNATDHRHRDGAVRLNFRHLFCALEFEINNFREEEVEVSELNFGGRDFFRDVSVTGQASGYDVGTERYSGRFDLLGGNAIVCPAATPAEGGGVVPGTVRVTVDGTADGERVTLLFITENDGTNASKISEGECFVNITTGVGGERAMNLKEGMTFQPGVKSIFSINIVGNDFILQMRPVATWDDGWEEGAGNEIVFQ